MDSHEHTSRDDLLTVIHKALRAGLLQVTLQAGCTDWTDSSEVAALVAAWDTVEHLVHAHAGHEDRHIFALLERTLTPEAWRRVQAQLAEDAPAPVPV